MMIIDNTELCGMDVEPIFYDAPYSVYVLARVSAD
jgi:hypothetical protein